MKRQTFVSGKKRKKILEYCCLLNFSPKVLSVKNEIRTYHIQPKLSLLLILFFLNF